jgi:hypothetical protein
VIGALAALLAVGMAAASPAAKQAGKKKSLGGIVQRTAAGQGSGNEAVVTATATCPRRTRAINGGFSLQPPLGANVAASVYESVRAGARSWRSTAQIAEPNAPDDVVTLTTTVSCRRNAPKLKTAAATVPLPLTSPATVSAPVTATCPKGRKAIAGGFATGKPVIPGTDATGHSVTDSFRASAGSWSTRIFSGPATSLTTHAYCAKRSIVPFVISAPGTTVSASLSPGASSAACRKKLKGPAPLGGGFIQNAAAAPPYGWFAVRASFPNGGNWEVVGDHLALTPTTLTAQAYCGV